MTPETLPALFYKNHEALIIYINELPAEQFQLSKKGKWTPGQQLSHQYLCLKPIAQAMASKEYIRQKFGVISRKTMDFNTVVKKYKAALKKGGKAPERFVPGQVELKDKEQLSKDIFHLLRTIHQQLKTYTDEELDTLILPHPLLGNLTIRELLYLMTYHATHHHLQTKNNLEL